MTSDLMTLSPFVSRYTGEKVTPIMEHVYYICQKKKILPELPPELADNPEFEIDYVGRLSLATKNFETQGAVNTARMFMELGEGDPRFMQALDYVDTDKMFKDMWFSNSASMNALKDGKKVKEERAQRKQEADEQKQIDNLAPVADAAQKMSGATDPTSLLEQMKEGQ
jgi:hypothetical protein